MKGTDEKEESSDDEDEYLRSKGINIKKQLAPSTRFVDSIAETERSYTSGTIAKNSKN